MTAKFQIIAPETTTNIVRNPSAEINLTDWLADGSAISRSDVEARFGRFSVEVITNGVIPNEGAHVRSFPGTSGTPYAGSAYIRGSGRVQLRLRDGFNGDEIISDPLSLNPDRWIRISDVVGRTGAAISNDLAVHIETVGIQATTFYIDGVQIEEKPYSTTYIDGDQDGGRWNIQRHLSVSDRLSSERSGGRLLDLDEEELGLYVTITSGIGMPPVRHNVQGRALQAGVEFQSTKVLPRVLQMTVWVRNPQSCPGALERLHEVRQDLIDIIKPDRVDPDQSFVIRYNGGAVPMEIEALYEAGLQFDGDVRNQFFNSFVVRFLSTDPFWFEDDQHVEILNPIEILQVQNGLMAKINSVWNNLGLVNNRILGSAIGPDGNLYVTGDFTVIGGVGANGVAYYDGTNWFPLGAGLNLIAGPDPNPTGINIAFGSDGSLYVCGNFNDAGGIANTIALARWDFDAATWNSVGGGLDDSAFSMAFAPDGSLYIVGDFLNADPAGAPVTVTRIARFVNGAWQALVDTGTGLGNGLTAAAGLEVAVGSNGIVYIGGAFTDAGGVADTDSIAQWDPAAQEFASMGGDANNDIRAIAVAPDGRVYAGGTFTDIGGISLNRAAVWNGSSWSQLAGGLDDDVRWIFISAEGVIYFVGDFTEALDVNDIAVPNTDHVVLWDGSQWVPEEFTVPANLTRMRTVVVNGNSKFYGGEGAVGDAFVSVPNEIDSLATAGSFPIFFFRRINGTSATLILILNEDSSRQLKFTYEMADGEEVEVDFRPGKRTITSSLFASSTTISEILQNQLGNLVPGSDFASFFLIPGENIISIFITVEGSTELEASMRWQPLHWSADAVEV